MTRSVKRGSLGDDALQWRHKDIMPSQIVGNSPIPSISYSGGKQRQHQISPLMVPVTGGSSHKGPTTRNMSPYHDVILTFMATTGGCHNESWLNFLQHIWNEIPSCDHGRHYSDAIMGAMASQITGVSIVYSIVCSGADQRKHQCSASLAFVRGIRRRPVNSPHEGPVTRRMLPFDDVIIQKRLFNYRLY